MRRLSAQQHREIVKSHQNVLLAHGSASETAAFRDNNAHGCVGVTGFDLRFGDPPGKVEAVVVLGFDADGAGVAVQPRNVPLVPCTLSSSPFD
jgi:hypothetical protein